MTDPAPTTDRTTTTEIPTMTDSTDQAEHTAQLPAPDGSTDPHAWLEDVTGEEALDWVRERNARAESALESVQDPADPDGAPLAETLQGQIREILDAIEEWAGRGEEQEQRVRESAGRMLALKEELGLL